MQQLRPMAGRKQSQSVFRLIRRVAKRNTFENKYCNMYRKVPPFKLRQMSRSLIVVARVCQPSCISCLSFPLSMVPKRTHLRGMCSEFTTSRPQRKDLNPPNPPRLLLVLFFMNLAAVGSQLTYGMLPPGVSYRF